MEYNQLEMPASVQENIPQSKTTGNWFYAAMAGGALVTAVKEIFSSPSNSTSTLTSSAVVAAAAAFQSKFVEMSSQVHLTDKQIEMSANLQRSQQQFEKNMQNQQFEFDKAGQLMQIFADLEQNEEQLENDLHSASMEAQRDMYDASNQKLQTLILASTVMFVALSTVIVQGDLSSVPTPPEIEVIYCLAIFGSISFACLFLSINICLETLKKTSKFMMQQSDFQQYQTKRFFRTEIPKSQEEYVQKVNRYFSEGWERQTNTVFEKLYDRKQHRQTVYNENFR